MTQLEKGPLRRRRGRGARERILGTSQNLFRNQDINPQRHGPALRRSPGIKRTAYQHFAGKDEIVAEYLRRFDPDVMPGVLGHADLTPSERLLAAFEIPASTPLCPYIAAAVEQEESFVAAAVRSATT